MTQTFVISGLREALHATAQLSKEAERAFKAELREVAEPIRAEAQARFLAEISPHPKQSRYGISIRKVGTVSVEQRVKARTGRASAKRRNFSGLQWRKALGPAAEHNEAKVEAAMTGVLDRLADKWAA